MREIIVFFVILSAIKIKAAEKVGYFNGPSVIQETDRTRITNFNILIKELSSQNWEDDKICLDYIMDSIDNAINATLWATWIWDSMQLPVGQLYGSRYHLGNYDQCLREKVGSSRPPYSMQYCLADILLQSNTGDITPETIDAYGSADAYVKSKTMLEQRFNEMSWGLCVPRLCQKKSVERFARVLLKQSYLGYLKSPDNVTINCEFPRPEGLNGLGILLAAGSFLTIMFIVACTLYASVKSNDNSSAYGDIIIRSFCLKRNAKELLQRPKNDVSVLHGIRFITCAMTVLLHVIFLILSTTTANGLDLEEEILTFNKCVQLFIFSVDTFFVISGLLFMMNIKKNGTTQDLMYSLIRRYFRLIWWFVINLIFVFFVPNSGCGPLYSKFIKVEKENCRKTWWSGLLMIANYHDVYSICQPFTWSVFCDFQMSVVASIVFWICQRRKRVGFTCFTVLIVLSVLLPGYFTYFGGDFSNTSIRFDMHRTMRDNQTTTMATRIYFQTHFRASPYLIGMMMGYIMSNCKADDIRNFFTKKRIIKGLLSSTLIGIITLVAYENGGVTFKNALYMSLDKPFWALLVCILIGVCQYGSFPIVKDALSWEGFVPLSKLTYGIYMVHMTSIALSLWLARSPLHSNIAIWIEKFLAHLMISALLSLMFMLFVESPLNNIVRIVLSKRGSTRVKICDEAVANTRLKTCGAPVKKAGNGCIDVFKIGTNGVNKNITTSDLLLSVLKEKQL